MEEHKTDPAASGSYGKQILNALRYIGIDTDAENVKTNWPEMAKDKGGWDSIVSSKV